MQEQQITLEEMLSANDGAPEYDMSQYDMSEEYPNSAGDELSTIVSNDGDIPEYQANYVMNADGKYLNVLTKSILAPMAYDHKHLNQTPLNSKGFHIKPSTAVSGLLTVVDGLMYSPVMPIIFTYNGKTMLNEYRDPDYGAVIDENNIAYNMMKLHMSHLFNDPETEQLMMDWMAHQVQNIGRIVRYCPVIIGVPGDGKTTIFEFIRAAISNENAGLVSSDVLKSTFTDWATGSAVVGFEEIRISGSERYNVTDKIKPFITNAVIEIHGKRIKGMKMHNYTNYIGFSNHADAIPVDEVDRRYWVMHTQFFGNGRFSADEYSSYFDSMYKIIEERPQSIRAALLQHVISDKFKIMRVAPVTDAKSNMISKSMPEGALSLLEVIDALGGDVPWANDEWVNGTLLSSEKSNLNMNISQGMEFIDKYPSGKAIEKCFADIGYTHSKSVQIRSGSGRRKCVIYSKVKIESTSKYSVGGETVKYISNSK